ncbi:MAG: hypothetical protein J5I93_17655 [Pirellulaceae bacterium]|nr:hypothetical protein [Pirellulaceae bacterium]
MRPPRTRPSPMPRHRQAGSSRPDRPSSADDGTPASAPQSRSAWQPRFGIGGLLLAVSLCSVLAAAGFYLTRMLLAPQPQQGRPSQLVFVLLTMAAPPLVMVVLTIVRLLWRRK